MDALTEGGQTQPVLSVSQWLALHGLAVLAGVLIYVVTSHAMSQRRSPAAAIAWVLFILLVPYLALPAYVIFGARKLPRRNLAAIATLPRFDPTAGWAMQAAQVLGQPPPAAYRDLELHADGREASAALMQAIDGAQHTIDLCTFILRRDAIGNAVMNRLCERARNGVRVRVLVDGLGYLMAAPPDTQPLIAAGGAWTLFVPPVTALLRGRANLRNHRKMLIVDAGRASARLWCGGRNLGVEYFDGQTGSPPWRDLSFDLRGDVVAQAAALFEHDWTFTTKQRPDAGAPAAQTTQISARGAQLLASGPDQTDDTLHALLLTAAFHARQRIAIVTPYFVPDASLLQALCLAARRGVSIELLVPERSNHRLSDIVRSRSLRALAQAGARVNLATAMLHAKLIVIDDSLALAGSANVDTRSLFLNYEMMMAFHDHDDVRRFAVWFEEAAVDSHPFVAVPPSVLRDVAEGVLLWMAFEL